MSFNRYLVIYLEIFKKYYLVNIQTKTEFKKCKLDISNTKIN